MKRSEVNAIMSEADAFIRGRGFFLPRFAYWSPADWRGKMSTIGEIVNKQLGWDITDFGSGDFKRRGLFLFTLRNGGSESVETRLGKTYAEKLMVVGIDQVTPLHFHWVKMEDIINRGGGQLVIQLYNSTLEEGLSPSRISVRVDGEERVVEPGGTLALDPGESVTLPPRLYHQFWGRGDRVLVGEVSGVNDDRKDNRFYETLARFPDLVEDEPPLHLLCTDYDRYAGLN